MRVLLLLILAPFLCLLLIPIGAIVIGLGAGLIGAIVGLVGATFGVIIAFFAAILAGLVSLGLTKGLFIILLIVVVGLIISRRPATK